MITTQYKVEGALIAEIVGVGFDVSIESLDTALCRDSEIIGIDDYKAFIDYIILDGLEQNIAAIWYNNYKEAGVFFCAKDETCLLEVPVAIIR